MNTINPTSIIEDNVTLLGNIEVMHKARILKNAVVDFTIPPYAIVSGNPAHIIGYDLTSSHDENFSTKLGQNLTEMPGVDFYNLNHYQDDRGALVFGEAQNHIPFEIKRFFAISDIKRGASRGDHAHKICHQFIICLSGAVDIVVNDGKNRIKYHLSHFSQGLHVKPKNWASLYNFSTHSSVVVFTSHTYDRSEYILDYKEFIKSL